MDWLRVAKEAFEASTSYVDTNYRKKWEDDLRMFQSKHPKDSKYNTDAYKHRSKIFRPKSRSVVRKNEAAAAAAYFSNIDVISTDAVDQGNPEQVASAAVMKEILNYRLQKTIPWFQILVGGFQDAQTVGVVCSYQYWKYREKPTKEMQPVIDAATGQPYIGMDGQPMLMEVEGKEVKVDKPCIELIPVENIRIDPGADWLDPINSSPYVIRLIPMYVVDLKAKMDEIDPKTNSPKWKKLDDGQIISASDQKYDSTRQIREGKREDSKDSRTLSEFEIVWVHENFVRSEDDEYCYYTLGTEHLLTDPKPLSEVYFHGERPLTMGVCVIETHKLYPPGVIGLGEQLQREANEVANQRLDNVKLVLNKRYIVKRGSQTDLKSLVRNVPGSITMATNPTDDVREVEFNDVTQSAYAEQDRINMDYDELVGNFSSSSVGTNRKLNETVGGMGLISQGASQMTEYTIRTYTETWVEPTLRQLVKLEQYYETDEVVLALAADRAQLFQRFGVSKVTDDLLKQDLTIKVNVGMGATDPIQKLNRFIGALKTYAEISQLPIQGVNLEEAGKEIFGLAGYQDGRRFLGKGDPQANAAIQQAQQMVQQAQQFVAEQSSILEEEKAKLTEDRFAIEGDAMKSAMTVEREATKARELKAAADAAMREVTDKIEMAQKDAEISDLQYQQMVKDAINQVEMIAVRLQSQFEQSVQDVQSSLTSIKTEDPKADEKARKAEAAESVNQIVKVQQEGYAAITAEFAKIVELMNAPRKKTATVKKTVDGVYQMVATEA